MNDNDRLRNRCSTIAAALWLATVGPAVARGEGPAVPIAGTVVDASRRPASGAEILFSRQPVGCRRGQVIARSRADAEGRFRLEVPAAPEGGPAPGMLWAYRPGALAAVYPVDGGTVPPDWPIALVLDDPTRAEFLVQGPDGRPVAGARVRPSALSHPPLAIPDELADRVEAEAVADARGRAVIAAFFPEEIAGVTVTAPGLGRQSFALDALAGSRRTRTLALNPVGRVEGVVVADDPAALRNRKLRAGIWITGHATLDHDEELTTDEQGRFVIPEAPVGYLVVTGNPPPGSPWILTMNARSRIEAGRTIRVEVRPVKGVRISGTVRERGTDIPIPGAVLALDGGERDPAESVTTDLAGRFTLFAQPRGWPAWVVVAPPEGFAAPPEGAFLGPIPASVEEFEPAAILLDRAGAVSGVVVDDRGEPVTGAVVVAATTRGAIPPIPWRQRRAVAGRDGAFRIVGLAAGTDVILSAVAADGRRTGPTTAARAGAVGPVRLSVATGRSTSLAGRVVDALGHRVAGARVHLRELDGRRTGAIQMWVGWDVPALLRGAHTIRTRADGWFRTPVVLDPDLRYAAIVEADGYEPARSDPVPGNAGRFPEIVLRRRAEPGLAIVEGAVVNGAGRPVAGASAWMPADEGTPIRASANAEGRFRLEGVPPRRSFLFIEADGFRLAGRVIDPSGGSVLVALTRADERPARGMTTPSHAGTRARERSLSHRLIFPYLERVQKGDAGAGGWGSKALDILAHSDPKRVLDLNEGGVREALRRLRCAEAIWEDDHASALAVIGSIAIAEWRVGGHLFASRALPADDRRGRLDQVDRAREQARAIDDPATRLYRLGLVAARYLELGEVEKGSALLREAVPEARALPKGGMGDVARGQLAEALARIDPAGAWELIGGGAPGAADRRRLDVIRAIAAVDPARAEDLLATIDDPGGIADHLPALCHAMARKDPARARRLADRVPRDPPAEGRPARRAADRALDRAYAIGMIALAQADANPDRAARSLDEAFAALKALADEGGPSARPGRDAATIAAALLPVAERIDPALVPEYFWRAASLRRPPRPPAAAGAIAQPIPEAVRARLLDRLDSEAATREATLALLLARYDRDAAMVLLAPLLDRRPIAGDAALPILARALAAVAPERAVALVESTPDGPRPDPRGAAALTVRDYARLELAGFLGHPPRQRWEDVTRLLLDLWVPVD